MARMGVGAEVSTRLYLEGYHVENALLNVQATSTVGGPSTAQLSMVPTNTAKHIMPGTWVHVFTTDPWNPEPQGDLSDFKLLFEGIVVGRGFTKETGGRHLVLQCADPSIHWVNARQFWMNLTQSGGGMVNQLAIAASGGFGRFVAITDQPLNGFMLSKLASNEERGEERFLDTLISLLDDVGNVNTFYNNSRNRFRITDRILKTSAGKTDQLFTLSLLTDFLNGLVGRNSGQSNLAQTVNILLAPIFHEWVSVLAPPILNNSEIFSRDSYGNIRKIPVKGQGDDGQTTLTSFEKATDIVLGTTIFKPQVYTISPPTCNVLFPNMYDHQSYSENFLTETTRVSMSPQLPIRGSENLISALHLLRPNELEIFRAVTQGNQTRTEDAKFGDGEGQTANLNDFDWTTNEERVRGIAYNFLNLPPAASTLTLTDQGKSAPEGTGGGVIQYLQNVASYEYYKSKYMSRSSSFTGPYNMRPVAGFPLLALDDSEANMNIVAYLYSVTQVIDAKGTAQTTYGVKYPRVLGEVNLNRPIFEDAGTDRTDVRKIATDDKGQFRFERIFNGQNRPAIPEWFGDAWSNVAGLNKTYEKLLGVNQFSGDSSAAPVRAVDSIMFGKDAKVALNFLKNAKYPPSTEILVQVAEIQSRQDVGAEIGEIDLQEIATVLNERYAKARNTGREFEEASRFTARPFAKIDEAFRFIGAKPKVTSLDKSVDEQDARFRKPNYRTETFDRFEGDTSDGAGYAGVPIQKGEAPASGGTRLPQMSGAFPLFDTRNRSNVTDKIRTKEAVAGPAARYDGRPVMTDFEKRIFEESKKQAGVAQPTFTKKQLGQKGFLFDDTIGTTPEQQLGEYERQRANLLAAAQNSENPTPEESAPTGAELNNAKKLPLPRPMSENQVVELRRRVIEAYRDELKASRGFTG